jgi:hypothetical protein
MKRRFNDWSEVSGIEHLGAEQLDTRRILSLGRGRQSQIWAVVRLRQNHTEAQAAFVLANLDAEAESDKLFSLGSSILRWGVRATVERAKIFLGIRLYPLDQSKSR